MWPFNKKEHKDDDVPSVPKGPVMSEQTKVDIANFLADHKDLLIIVADPETDSVVVGYKDYLEAHRPIDKSTQEPSGIVKNMLLYKKGDKEVKQSLEQFLLLIDGSVHGISNHIKNNH